MTFNRFKSVVVILLLVCLNCAAIENVEDGEKKVKPFVKKEYVRKSPETLAQERRRKVFEQNRKMAASLKKQQELYRSNPQQFRIDSKGQIYIAVTSENEADDKAKMTHLKKYNPLRNLIIASILLSGFGIILFKLRDRKGGVRGKTV